MFLANKTLKPIILPGLSFYSHGLHVDKFKTSQFCWQINLRSGPYKISMNIKSTVNMCTVSSGLCSVIKPLTSFLKWKIVSNSND